MASVGTRAGNGMMGEWGYDRTLDLDIARGTESTYQIHGREPLAHRSGVP